MKPVPNSQSSVKIAKRTTLKEMRQVISCQIKVHNLNNRVPGGRYMYAKVMVS